MSYKLKKESFGYKLTFSKKVDTESLVNWIDATSDFIDNPKKPFGLLVDLREMYPLKQKNMKLLEQGQQVYKQSGLERVAVIVSSGIVQLQIKKASKNNNLYSNERYINPNKNPQWRYDAIRWIESGIEPNN